MNNKTNSCILADGNITVTDIYMKHEYIFSRTINRKQNKNKTKKGQLQLHVKTKNSHLVALFMFVIIVIGGSRLGFFGESVVLFFLC